MLNTSYYGIQLTKKVRGKWMLKEWTIIVHNVHAWRDHMSSPPLYWIRHWIYDQIASSQLVENIVKKCASFQTVCFFKISVSGNLMKTAFYYKKSIWWSNSIQVVNILVVQMKALASLFPMIYKYLGFCCEFSKIHWF